MQIVTKKNGIIHETPPMLPLNNLAMLILQNLPQEEKEKAKNQKQILASMLKSEVVKFVDKNMDDFCRQNVPHGEKFYCICDKEKKDPIGKYWTNHRTGFLQFLILLLMSVECMRFYYCNLWL